MSLGLNFSRKYPPHTSRSEAVNSYGIFHPRAPNFFLSCTTALKKHNPNRSLFQVGPGPESSHTDSVTTPPTPPKERSRFALIPGGGSTVICKIKKKVCLLSRKGKIELKNTQLTQDVKSLLRPPFSRL